MPTETNLDASTATTSSTAARTPHVAILGAGIMGGAMAGRLLDAGFEVSAWSRRLASTADLVTRGATAFDDPAAAVANAEVVISMLPNAEVTRKVVFDPAVIEALRPSTFLVQMGTLGITATTQLASELASVRSDIAFVDAPVSGSRVPAQNGQLLILASGPPEAVETLDPIFSVLGRSTLWLGPAGAGSKMKLVLNTWLAFQTEGAAESAALAEGFGLESTDLFRALRGNPLASDYALAKLERMVAGDYHADFSLDMALKDLDLVTAESPDAAPVAGAIARRWRALVDGDWSGSDVAAARNGLGDPVTG
jgi:3-hydroxyisobutyrate dehydrogenase